MQKGSVTKLTHTQNSLEKNRTPKSELVGFFSWPFFPSVRDSVYVLYVPGSLSA